MSRNRLTGIVAAAAVLALLVVGTVLFAPVQLGGGTGYVIATGSSMEPAVAAGDLVLTRKRSSYDVGDVVLVQSRTLGQDVLHRIVSRDGDRLVLQGDANEHRDAERPHVSQVRGEAWITVRGLGRSLELLGRPAALAALAFVLVLAVLHGGRRLSRRTATGSPREPIRVLRVRPTEIAAPPRRLLACVLASVLLSGLLALVSFGTPPTRAAEDVGAWTHAGTFSYEAAVPRSGVYPDGTLTTGDAVFTALVPRLRVAFDYRLRSRTSSDVRGTVGLRAVVGDDQGWERPLPLSVDASFAGSDARVEGMLDVAGLAAIVTELRELTGSTASSFTVRVSPTVEVVGRAGTALVDETFAPALDLRLDASALRPAPGADGSAPAFEQRQDGTGTIEQTRTVGLVVADVDVATARRLSLLALLLSLAAAAVLVGLGALRAGDGDDAGIRRRYGARIVSADVTVPENRWITDLRSIDELARVADHYDRPILRVSEPGGTAYLVDDGVGVYRYATGRSPAPAVRRLRVAER